MLDRTDNADKASSQNSQLHAIDDLASPSTGLAEESQPVMA